MNRNQRVPASPGGRSDASTVIGVGCAQILLPRKGKRPTIALSRRASGECRVDGPRMHVVLKTPPGEIAEGLTPRPGIKEQHPPAEVKNGSADLH